jgi:hypothetical protein
MLTCRSVLLMRTILELIRPKILRAMEHANAIDEAWTKYTSSQPYETFLKADSEHEYWRFTTEPPEDIALLAGELFYQCRSSLDHAFFELIKANQRGVVLPDGWERSCQFPIVLEAPTGYVPPVPREKFQSAARDWLSDSAFAHIEGLQPYNRRKDKAAFYLKLLAGLTNIDKHRRMSTILIAADQHETATTAAGTYSTVRLMVEPGAELAPLSEAYELSGQPMHMKRELIPVIAFNEPSVASPQSTRVSDLIHELPLLVLWVAKNLDYFTRNP